jgi:hypothetical protein
MLSLLGRSHDEVVGHRASEFVPDVRTARVDDWARHLDPAESSHQFPLRTPDGQLVHIEWTMSPRVEPNVNMAMATDISQRVLAVSLRHHGPTPSRRVMSRTFPALSSRAAWTPHARTTRSDSRTAASMCRSFSRPTG